MVTKYYNIHDLITIKVVNCRRIFDRLEHFETDNIEDADIDIILGNFPPPHSPEWELVDGKYWVTDHSIYCKYRHKLSVWKVWIDGFDQDKTTIYFYGDPFFSYDLMIAFILEPLMTYKLSKKGGLILHASSLSLNNKGFLFTGDSGTGKTTLLLKLLSSPHTKYFSDDQSFIKEGILYSYILPIGLRKHHVSSCELSPIVLDHMILYIHQFLNTITFFYPNLTYKVKPKNIRFKNQHQLCLGTKTPLKAIFVLTVSDQPPSINKLSREEAYRKILSHNEGNEDKLVLFHRHFSAYREVYPEVNYWEKFEEELQKTVNSGIDIYEIILNERYSFDDTLDKIVNTMNEVGRNKK